MRKAKRNIVDDIIQAILLGQEDTAFVDTQCIHVFKEDYVKRIETLKRNLFADNAAIAHYEVSRDIELWKQALADQKKAAEALKNSNEKIKNRNDELNVLKSRKKNIKIAVSLINKSLRYVFFSKDRLEIKVEDDKYVLYSHGKAVKPNNVSVGERNIIALYYFFTELIMNQEAKDGYSKKLILVIDDSVSSFDFDYFKNLMYRLVLNGDSHMLERTNNLDDMDYLHFLSDEERRRIAQEIICFIYLLNKRHVLVHDRFKPFEIFKEKFVKSLLISYPNLL